MYVLDFDTLCCYYPYDWCALKCCWPLMWGRCLDKQPFCEMFRKRFFSLLKHHPKSFVNVHKGKIWFDWCCLEWTWASLNLSPTWLTFFNHPSLTTWTKWSVYSLRIQYSANPLPTSAPTLSPILWHSSWLIFYGWYLCTTQGTNTVYHNDTGLATLFSISGLWHKWLDADIKVHCITSLSIPCCASLAPHYDSNFGGYLSQSLSSHPIAH